jgi:hypothetical protein
VLGAAAFWFIGIETRGRSLQEIDAALSAPAEPSKSVTAARTSH